MKLRSALLASALMATPIAAARSQAVDGLYVGAGAGLNFLQREKLTARTAGLSRQGDVRANLGPVVVLNMGWGFGNGLRVEGEASYRQNNGFNNPRGFGGPGSAGGIDQKYGAMANVLYDLSFVPFVQPYVGLGAGYQFHELQNMNVNLGVPAGSGPLTATQTRASTRGGFAYQAILGTVFPIPSAPNLAITAEYRFMGMVGDRGFTATVNGRPGNIISTENFNHSFLVGIRYAFNRAPVAAPFVPVGDVGAKTFLVFFDHNQSVLTSSSVNVVRDAAVYSRSTAHTRIDVDGNADTSGNPVSNVGLSERRARAVAAELVRNGVPQNEIQIHAYGDTKLLVPTGPGVREPQNRRVEIVFH